MAIVTGTLLDVGLKNIYSRTPELVWTPSSATTTTAGELLTALPIITTVGADGSWSVNLTASELCIPQITYSLKIRLLDPAAGYVWVDFPDWIFNIPFEGGPITTLVNARASAGMVWEVAGDTIPSLANPGDLMLNTLTSDLYRIG
jgi:hypothetical protein